MDARVNDDLHQLVDPSAVLAAPPPRVATPSSASAERLDAFARAPLVIFDWARAAVAESAEPVGDDLVEAARRELGRLVGVEQAEVLAALDRALLSDTAVEELDVLQRWGVLALLLPEVDALVGFHRSCAVHHKDLWDHTLQVLARMPRDADLRWAVLMHDAGKIATRAIGADGRVGFWRHEATGAYLMRGVAARLAMPAERAARVVFVIEHHGRVNAYDKRWSERAVSRLARDAGAFLGDLLTFSRADFTTKRTAKAERIQDNLRHLAARLAERDAALARGPRFPRGFGVSVAEALGVPPGPAVGEAIAWLDAEIDAGRLPERDDDAVWLEALRRRASQNG